MRKRSIIAGAALVAGVFASPFVGGGTAHAECTFHNITTISTPAATVYIDDRKPATDPLPGLVSENGEGTWIYLESNGRGGLQWGDPWLGQPALQPLNAENCTSMSNPDTMIL